ncbi:MAG: GNAT family N-acetyltransferase [Dehalococcoidia bacterium]|uniref:GNAT family N-acetyltransferase n=1 Tax=Candidatus Amarobacter glycogenicus TaxID=3140699 RepID=UPI003135C370|nr:GNAT family N-acetyltransferase [Dehalococcoidia bacterium]
MGSPAREALAIRRGEYGVASAILTEAANWLTQSGRQLWPSEEVSEDALRRRSAPDSVLTGYWRSIPVVTTLLEWRDDMFWPGIDDAGFIHRLAVRRAAAGQGHAQAMLEWAANEAASRGKECLRLDCVATRTRLCAFYERCGFERVGSWTRAPHYEQALYRRPVASRG